MKYRTAFVTNSSSSSYVISIDKNFAIETTDEKLKYFMSILSKEFGRILEDMGYKDSDYGFETFSTIEDLARHFIDNMLWDSSYKNILNKCFNNDNLDEKLFKDTIKRSILIIILWIGLKKLKKDEKLLKCHHHTTINYYVL